MLTWCKYIDCGLSLYLRLVEKVKKYSQRAVLKASNFIDINIKYTKISNMNSLHIRNQNILKSINSEINFDRNIDRNLFLIVLWHLHCTVRDWFNETVSISKSQTKGQNTYKSFSQQRCLKFHQYQLWMQRPRSPWDFCDRKLFLYHVCHLRISLWQHGHQVLYLHIRDKRSGGKLGLLST